MATSTTQVKNDRIRIKLSSFDHKLIDKAVSEIINTVQRTGCLVRGPVPLPTRTERYSVLRSPHVNKDSQEAFEIRTHFRLVDIIEPGSITVDALMKLNLASGVDVKIILDNVDE